MTFANIDDLSELHLFIALSPTFRFYQSPIPSNPPAPVPGPFGRWDASFLASLPSGCIVSGLAKHVSQVSSKSSRILPRHGQVTQPLKHFTNSSCLFVKVGLLAHSLVTLSPILDWAFSRAVIRVFAFGATRKTSLNVFGLPTSAVGTLIVDNLSRSHRHRRKLVPMGMGDGIPVRSSFSYSIKEKETRD